MLWKVLFALYRYYSSKFWCSSQNFSLEMRMFSTFQTRLENDDSWPTLPLPGSLELCSRLITWLKFSCFWGRLAESCYSLTKWMDFSRDEIQINKFLYSSFDRWNIFNALFWKDLGKNHLHNFVLKVRLIHLWMISYRFRVWC